jgi:hypothetical protein
LAWPECGHKSARAFWGSTLFFGGFFDDDYCYDHDYRDYRDYYYRYCCQDYYGYCGDNKYNKYGKELWGVGEEDGS